MIIRFHAAARELAGVRETSLTFEGALDEAGLRERLAALFPDLAPLLPRMRMAKNDSFVVGDIQFENADEVDILPPVAGGTSAPNLARVPLAEIRDEALNLTEVMTAVGHDAAGAIATFVGVVRDHHDGKPVSRLDYEAHPVLAPKEMRRVLEQVALEFEGTTLAAIHRVGELGVGDIAIVLAVSSAHRAPAFDACRIAVDRIKETVPVWKKEWSEGEATWVNLDEAVE